MVSFEHKQLVKRIAEVDQCPDDDDAYQDWRAGSQHLEVLLDDVQTSELIVTALSPVSLIHTAVLDADHPGLQDEEGLRDWNCTLFEHSAAERGWVITGDEVRFEDVERHWGTSALAGGRPLVYGRTFEGLDDPESEYFEVAQPYVHHANAHWRSERSAFCRFDRSGDWVDVVSITDSFDSKEPAVISFSRAALDQYLVEHHAVLVRIFDFTFRRIGADISWQPSEFVTPEMSGGLTLTQQFAQNGSIAAVRGAQVIRPILTETEAIRRVRNWWCHDDESDDHVEFRVHDLRSDQIASVSTDPSTTTNYFEMAGNTLPHELSPAYFKPDVLSKYKADEDRYTVLESSIHCRGGWRLRSYHANEAGQVIVYIKDLRDLPRAEQRHWAIYNEEPQAGLPERAIMTDFLGQWPEKLAPREKLADVLQRWRSQDLGWWKWRPRVDPHVRIVVPRTRSRNEWEAAIARLYTDVVEGFDEKQLRVILEAQGVEVDKTMRSIATLERILWATNGMADGEKLSALRELNAGRNLGPAHGGESQGRAFVNRVLEEHETFAAHFVYLCETLVEQLTLIEQSLNEDATD